MAKRYPKLPFERFADDAIVHCRTEKEAQEARAAIAARLRECGLELHPEKTKVVYCKDEDRRRTYPNEKFDFLGYTFRPRRSKNREGKFFINFSPAASDQAVKALRAEIRNWNLHLRSDKSIEDLSRMFNPILRGWLQYYGRFYRSALYPPMRQLDRLLARWADRKYKKLRRHLCRATHWVARISRRDPKLWAHWQMGVRRGSMAGAVCAETFKHGSARASGCDPPGATHLVLLARTEQQARIAWDQLQREFAELHLVVNQKESRLTKLEEGFAFLGFEFRKARGRMLLTWPRTKACCNIRRRPVTAVLRKLNPVLNGWCTYFRVATATGGITKWTGRYGAKWQLWLRRKHQCAGGAARGRGNYHVLHERCRLYRMVGKVSHLGGLRRKPPEEGDRRVGCGKSAPVR